MFGWEPEPYYNISEVRGLAEMPPELKDHIEGAWIESCRGKGREVEERCPQLRMAWVSCEGGTPHDHEFMGRVTYVPKRGMPGYFFPYLNQGPLNLKPLS